VCPPLGKLRKAERAACSGWPPLVSPSGLAMKKGTFNLINKKGKSGRFFRFASRTPEAVWRRPHSSQSVGSISTLVWPETGQRLFALAPQCWPNTLAGKLETFARELQLCGRQLSVAIKRVQVCSMRPRSWTCAGRAVEHESASFKEWASSA